MSKLTGNLSLTAKTILTVITTLPKEMQRGPYTTAIKGIENIGRIADIARNKNVNKHEGKEDRLSVLQKFDKYRKSNRKQSATAQ